MQISFFSNRQRCKLALWSFPGLVQDSGFTLAAPNHNYISSLRVITRAGRYVRKQDLFFSVKSQWQTEFRLCLATDFWQSGMHASPMGISEKYQFVHQEHMNVGDEEVNWDTRRFLKGKFNLTLRQFMTEKSWQLINQSIDNVFGIFAFITQSSRVERNRKYRNLRSMQQDLGPHGMHSTTWTTRTAPCWEHFFLPWYKTAKLLNWDTLGLIHKPRTEHQPNTAIPVVAFLLPITLPENQSF